MKSGNVGPTGERLPKPDLLLLSYTGCFTFMKWFELLREEYNCPVAMLHVPYQADGRDHRRRCASTSSKQLRDEGDPGARADLGPRVRRGPAEGAPRALARRPRTTWSAVLESAKHRPSPIDAYFGGVYYVGPIFSAFRGTEDAVDYYRALRAEIEERIARRARARSRPTASMEHERFRLVVEGPPNWTSFREFWKMFADEGAVVVASTYTKVGGVYDLGLPPRPGAPARDARRLLPRLLHEPRTCRRASTCSRATSRSTRPTASSINSRQELQLVQRRPAA